MLAEHIMRMDIVIGHSNMNITEIAELMTNAHVGSVLIVKTKEDQSLEGIITDRDIVTRVISWGFDPNKTKVNSVMSKSIVTCRNETTIEEILSMFVKFGVRRIPVINRNDKLVGMISLTDVAQKLNGKFDPHELLKAIENNSQSEDFLQRRISFQSKFQHQLSKLEETIEALAFDSNRLIFVDSNGGAKVVNDISRLNDHRIIVQSLFEQMKNSVHTEKWPDIQRTLEAHWIDLNALWHSIYEKEFSSVEKTNTDLVSH